jgi:nitroimidazol reductase NimA-like FMN-containing flavoprotein (pyridoxamine 5'-phosphate oxidase superfamily)
MNAIELDSFLSRKRYAVLATARPDGRAHATPIAFSIWKDSFWVGSVGGVRVRNLQSHPWASVVVMEGEPPKEHRAVIGEGPVKLHDASELKNSLRGLAELVKQKHGNELDWATVIIELNPERLFSYDGTKKAG